MGRFLSGILAICLMTGVAPSAFAEPLPPSQIVVEELGLQAQQLTAVLGHYWTGWAVELHGAQMVRKAVIPPGSLPGTAPSVGYEGTIDVRLSRGDLTTAARCRASIAADRDFLNVDACRLAPGASIPVDAFFGRLSRVLGPPAEKP